MRTDCLFRDDSYQKSCEARVVSLTEQGGIVLDRTVFYATSGGQPGDTGALTTSDGRTVLIDNVVYTDAAKTEIAHLFAAGAPELNVGDTLTADIDWDKRHGIDAGRYGAESDRAGRAIARAWVKLLG